VIRQAQDTVAQVVVQMVAQAVAMMKMQKVAFRVTMAALVIYQ
jgi:hypothetical protein